ncbi:hypothetical protein GGX14DRAFT_424222, partial [Mycena pura]
MSCSICLSKLKDPVSIPCGHVYCTDCLTNHVTATSSDGFTSTCPSCRESFNMVRPEVRTAPSLSLRALTVPVPQLTCLPKKFHQYVIPNIRRIYIDTRHDGQRKKLAASEARVKALEADKERLMAECERHIAAARAHSRGETDALLRAEALENELVLTRKKRGPRDSRDRASSARAQSKVRQNEAPLPHPRSTSNRRKQQH